LKEIKIYLLDIKCSIHKKINGESMIENCAGSENIEFILIPIIPPGVTPHLLNIQL
jgi:hypothetical protein